MNSLQKLNKLNDDDQFSLDIYHIKLRIKIMEEEIYGEAKHFINLTYNVKNKPENFEDKNYN